MPTLREVIDAADAEFEGLITRIVNAQAARRSAGKPFLQILETHLVPPADGETKLRDATLRRPTNETESIADLAAWPAGSKASYKIDVYGGPNGEGFAITTSILYGGSRYERARNYGPAGEAWRQHNWKVVE